MPTLPTSELPKPSSWVEFEDIVWELYRRRWQDPNAQRNGRAGQRQHGVDIYGQPTGLDGAFSGIQCKRYEVGKLTTAQLSAELTEAENFRPTLAEYIIATTDNRDSKLQEVVRSINVNRISIGRFPLRLIFWDDICSELTHPNNFDLLKKYYSEWQHVFLHAEQDTFLDSGAHLVRLAQFTPATATDITKYYKGAQLHWGLIAANADIERDRCKRLIHDYSNAMGQPRMLCITGGPGAGKSTLAWRIAAQITLDTGCPLIHIRNKTPAAVWYKLELAVPRLGGQLVVLADDIFRDHTWQQALESINRDTSITIISTSRTNEIPASLRLPYDFKVVRLGAPTSKEKTRVLEKLRRQKSTPTQDQERRLSQAKSWWEMMLELTTGQDLIKIVVNTVTQLRDINEVIYRAYEYLCFVGQYDLDVPESLISLLDPDGRFHNLLGYSAAAELISRDRYDRTALRGNSPMFCRKALDIYNSNSLKICADYVERSDPTSYEHRAFLGRLFMALAASGKHKLLHAVISLKAEIFTKILASSSSVELLDIWARLYDTLIDPTGAAELRRSALRREPKTWSDWIACCKLFDEKPLLDDVDQFVDHLLGWWPHTYARKTPQYLGPLFDFIERMASETQVSNFIQVANDWLARVYIPTPLFLSVFDLISRRGSEKYLRLLPDFILRWLKQIPVGTTRLHHVVDTIHCYWSSENVDNLLCVLYEELQDDMTAQVREFYFKLIELSPSRKNFKKSLKLLDRWLAHNPFDRAGYLDLAKLVQRFGRRKEQMQAAFKIAWWLRNNPDTIGKKLFTPQLLEFGETIPGFSALVQATNTSKTRIAYLHFIERLGTKRQISLAINDTEDWLEKAPEDRQVRKNHISFVRQWGTQRQKAILIRNMHGWVVKHPEDNSVHRAYDQFLADCFAKGQKAILIRNMHGWVVKHPEDNSARATYLHFVVHFGSPVQIARCIKQNVQWIAARPILDSFWPSIFELLDSSSAISIREKIIDAQLTWIANNQWDESTLERFFELVLDYGAEHQLVAAHDIGMQWLEYYPSTQNARIYELLGWILYDLSDYFEAEMAFRNSLGIWPRHCSALIGLGWSLFYQGAKEQTLRMLMSAKEIAALTENTLIGAVAYQLGKYYLAEGAFDEAAIQFLESIKLHPNDFFAHWKLGAAWLASGQFQKALMEFQNAETYLSPKVPLEARSELERAISIARHEVSLL